MSIVVLRGGMLSVLQDRGRKGYQKVGMLVNGAMDEEALRLGNILTGNEQQEAGLEITMLGPVLKFSQETLIALTGADMDPRIDGRAVPMWRPVLVRAGAVLRFGHSLSGCRSYLCVSGGYDVPSVMGSKSTYLQAHIGGYQGRALVQGDVLSLGRMSDQGRRIVKTLHDTGGIQTSDWYVEAAHRLYDEVAAPVRLTAGLQYSYFTEDSLQRLVSEPFRITVHSDRMGYRLEGCQLRLKKPLEMISEAAVQGTIQVPADGNPIILMADRQSTAGYPKIGQVIMADMSRLAQYRPGDWVRFAAVTIAQAEALFLEREQYIRNIAVSVQYRLA
ncbi:biotin-dependent carboxyltransferase family protein [Megasphaera cerevisiae]|uniref:5-oxoprolinase subunit C family protein n=1 Tax=Megasphaera cerevisiae TaxID=39029 RepID=UPI0009420064|nr:biotin-dependent carboxyltransferase family protein [Megasphaera cerevisiae]MCI1751164.1 biotin-dependent carboxyltransferase family protein [Megasphaera cerevisiae]OKY52845.1 KipI antagonist [Megasphaera cerevisiae]